jgi:hypothetical protein
MFATQGKAYEYKGEIAVKTTRPAEDNLSDDVLVVWHDKRSISPEQRRKAWALIGEISAAYGYMSAGDKEQLNRDLKRQFLLQRMDELTAEAIKAFSLGDVDMTTARLYITFLIEFVVEHDIPTRQMTAELCEDVEAYVYACVTNKRCCICRKPADLHHIDRVGMGRNRDDMVHIGMEAITLCRDHHRQAHDHGDAQLLNAYHLMPIVVDERIAKIHKLGRVTDAT